MAISRSLNATRARQGRFGVHMFWVLAVSTALAALALFGAWSWRADDLNSTLPSKAGAARTAQHFDTGEPAALQNAPSATQPTR
jgi:hypothetical protein